MSICFRGVGVCVSEWSSEIRSQEVTCLDTFNVRCELTGLQLSTRDHMTQDGR